MAGAPEPPHIYPIFGLDMRGAGQPGDPHIRLIFGLDMRGAGQPGRLRRPSGSDFHD